MKVSPEDFNLNKNLQPSKFSSEGFLGDDARTFDEIVAEDRTTIEKIGVTKDKLVSELKTVYDKSKRALGAEIEIAPNVFARFYESMGRIPSPFKGEGVFEKGEAVITSKMTNQQLIITSLSIHLIEKHDFFQGKGSRYRLDPERIIKLLNVKYVSSN